MRLYLKLLSLLALFSCTYSVAFAQGVTIRGVIFKKSSTTRVSQAVITDLNNKTLMMSDELGMFSINASIGDTLLIAKNSYTPIRLIVLNKEDLVLYMQPVVELDQVTVKGETKKQELNNVMKQYKSQGIFFDGKSPPVWTWINSPLTGLFNVLGKTPADARRFAAYSKAELESNEVSRRYTKELVKSVTKLSDEDVPKFMNFYTPSYPDIKEWNDYQLIAAIKKNFSYYQRRKEQPQPLQKLY